MLLRKLGPRKRLKGKPCIRVYVDGANDKVGYGGWGAVVFQPQKAPQVLSGPMYPATNQTAEMTAAIEGLRKARSLVSSGVIEVISDSKYVVLGITDWIYVWKECGWKTTSDEDVKNLDLWHELFDLDGPDVRWTHVRGHRGITGNEMADKAAVQAKKDARFKFPRETLDEVE